MPASNYLRKKIIDLALRGVPFEPPAQLYVGLNAGDPTANALNTEPTKPWYSRRQAVFSEQIVPGITSNNQEIKFPRIVGDAFELTHLSIWDAPRGGNMLFYDSVPRKETLSDQDFPTVTEGQLVAFAT